MKSRLFSLAAAVSLALCLATSMVWVRSFGVPDPSSDLVTGAADMAPPRPHLLLPIPSEASEYWVAIRGNFERWEYTDWDRKWYRLNGGISAPIWAVAGCFAILPLAWLVNRKIGNERTSAASSGDAVR